MEEVLEQYMIITGLVDLMGREILPQVEHGKDTQMIPEGLEETVIEGTPDDEEFEDYQGNVSSLDLSGALGFGSFLIHPTYPAVGTFA